MSRRAAKPAPWQSRGGTPRPVRLSRDEECCLRAQQAYMRGDLAAAEAEYRSAVAAGTKVGDAYNNLGALCDRRGLVEEAVGHFERALRLEPHRADVRENLQKILRRRAEERGRAQRFADAAADWARLVELAPGRADARHELGAALDRAGRPAEAVAHLRAALAVHPVGAGSAGIQNDLGVVLMKLGDGPGARAAFEAARAADPALFGPAVNLGILLGRMGLLGEAASLLREALARDPAAGAVHWNLANVLREAGDLTASLRHYDQALPLLEGVPARQLACQSARLLTLNYLDDVDPDAIASAHRAYGETLRALCGPPRIIPPRDPHPHRRLRVGYLSPDLRQHSVAYFLEAVLTAHDRSAVEVTAYADDPTDDETTARLRARCDRFRSVAGASGDALAARIAEDEIDVLVDLAGHTANNRLPLLATRVAPVQVTYLGYPNTTGLDVVDLRVSDAVADPAGSADARHSEEIVRLPGGFLCYTAPPEAAALPVVSPEPGRPFTFGSFNQLAKLGRPVIAAWARILAGAPDARLLLKGKGLGDEAVRSDLLARFAAAGVARERIQLVGYVASKAEHFQLYAGMDLALDPFPYNGTTTTCEALWMGVPVLTVAGQAHAGRVGASLLTHAGLSELVTESVDAYVEAAIRFATRRQALTPRGAGLRERLARSPVMDGGRLGRALEAVYRRAWQRACDAHDAEAQSLSSVAP